MSMALFDTLKYVERLKATGVPEAQAKAEAEVLSEALAEAFSTRDLVTRDHLDHRIQEVRTEIQELRGDLRTEIHEVRGDLRTEIHEVRGDLRTEIQSVRADLIRWMAGLMLAQAGLVVSLIKLLD